MQCFPWFRRGPFFPWTILLRFGFHAKLHFFAGMGEKVKLKVKKWLRTSCCLLAKLRPNLRWWQEEPNIIGKVNCWRKAWGAQTEWGSKTERVSDQCVREERRRRKPPVRREIWKPCKVPRPKSGCLCIKYYQSNDRCWNQQGSVSLAGYWLSSRHSCVQPSFRSLFVIICSFIEYWRWQLHSFCVAMISFNFW